jgi:hypothetical protein
MVKACFPTGVRVNEMEFVFPGGFFLRVFDTYSSRRQYRCSIHHIGASLIQSHGVKGSGNANAWHYGCVIVIPAVAFGRNVHDEVNVEMRFVMYNGLGILCNLAAEQVRADFTALYG